MNLNHDLEQSKNVKLDNDTRYQLLDFALDVIQIEFYKEIMTNLSILEDPDRYYNWYHGYTQLKYTYTKNGDNQLLYIFSTSATTGNMSTQYFGEKFNTDKVDGNIRIIIMVWVPRSARSDHNATLMFDIKKETMKEVSDNDKMSITGRGYIDADLTHWSENITVPSTSYRITLHRQVTEDDIDNLDLDMMPGFRFTWNYMKHVEPWAKFSNHKLIKQFVRYIFYKVKYLMILTSIFRLVNILEMTKVDEKNVKKIVRQIRKSFFSVNIDPTCQEENTLLSDGYIKDNIDVVEEKLKLNIGIALNKSVADETLKFAANLFTYLNYCPPKDFYVLSVIKSQSAKNILLALISMMKTSQNAGKKSSTKIFKKAMEIFKLRIYRDIDKITKEKGIDNNGRDDFKHYSEILEVLGYTIII